MTASLPSGQQKAQARRQRAGPCGLRVRRGKQGSERRRGEGGTALLALEVVQHTGIDFLTDTRSG